MNGPYAEEYGAGGPDDDGVAAGVWRAFQRLDDAREAFVAAAERPTPLDVLLTSLSAPEGGGVR